MTTTTKKNHGAVKGTVAAAAGIAVLLGGAGTFALWNQSGDIGISGTGTGQLTADFGAMEWQDVTPNGVAAHDVDPEAFRMVPGDVLEGTATIDYAVTGENILVKPELTGVDGATQSFLDSGKLTVTTALLDGSTPVTELVDGDTGTLTAKVTIAYAADASNGTSDADMNQTVDLDGIEFVLQQQAPANRAPAAP